VRERPSAAVDGGSGGQRLRARASSGFASLFDDRAAEIIRLVNKPNQTALYAQVPPEQIGTASGLFRTFGYIGSIASPAIISITFRFTVSDHGLHVIALIMIAVSAVALLLTIADRHLMSQATAHHHPAETPAEPPAERDDGGRTAVARR
jgi:MFS family permease